MKRFKKFLPIFLVLILIFVGGCTDKADINGENNKTVIFHGKGFPMTLSGNVEIAKAFLYSGEFPEDGSFKEVQDVFALKVTNKSSDDLQLLRIFVVTDKNEYLFEVTSLPSDKSVTVLEKNAKTISDEEEILGFREENKIYFENKISLNTDKFEITSFDRVLNIKNISTSDISSDVYVYFKSVDADGDYFGGITFRSNAGTLKAGELKQIPASHFTKEGSEVLFVDYAKP